MPPSCSRLSSLTAWWPCLAVVACGAPPAAPERQAPAVVPQVQLGGDWVITEEDSSEVVIRWRDTADGVRVNLGGSERGVGVSPIVDGRTAELRGPDGVVPLIAPSFTPLSAVFIEVQGPDLLVRLEGPPLSDLTDHPDAPADPALAWVRLRPRGETWRIALRGMLTWTLPAEGSGVEERGAHRTITSSWGPWQLRGQPPLWRSARTTRSWTYDTAPSLAVQQPYPQVGLTWTPFPVSP